ncbi:3-dehydroquinate synthase [Paenibacillus cellulosilyticus]|uniref:3-dehydroquinate synthase n=1 Tax=Paenibacillus cellulosilyticus TaxID=375489 RepID=A0A2V2YZ54_9BACL|nr:2-deoxy-scyllo-inosose synthase [Paenibacillus cellulosilyticus]PWW06551.1 3-dehydroquinate synthase [Paenibacillus cellulosilyticus]QKS46113.1 iron-containing alcohol dehydrogenase [Paenibacillus cellulosilyticus]
MFHTIIQFGDHRYPFMTGVGVLAEAGNYVQELHIHQYMIITDEHTPDHIVKETEAAFGRLAPVRVLTFQPGEEWKNLSTVHELCKQVIDLGADRRTAIVALGGGVSGNVAGMVAGLLFRGLPLIHVPTTLMSASDSVLSLKQAVNLTQGKNLVGMFYTPKLICVELPFLQSLAERDLRSGMCELVKNLLAICPERINEYRRKLRPNNQYELDELQQFIAFCIEAKTKVMADDPYEKKDGLVLEYGHTIGHALELTCKGKYTHGECISFGMLCAAYISQRLGLLTAEETAMHHELLERIGYQVELEPEWLPIIEQYVQNDNKRGYRERRPGCTGMVLLNGLGTIHREDDAWITMVDNSLISEAIRSVQERRAIMHGSRT